MVVLHGSWGVLGEQFVLLKGFKGGAGGCLCEGYVCVNKLLNAESIHLVKSKLAPSSHGLDTVEEFKTMYDSSVYMVALPHICNDDGSTY